MQLIVPGTDTAGAPPAIVTVGVFDGVHRGHRHLFEQLNAKARELRMMSAVVTFTRHPLEVVGGRPAPLSLCSLPERLALMATCGIDACVLLPFTASTAAMNAREFLEKLGSLVPLGAVMTGYNNSFGRKDHHRPDEAARLAGLPFFRAEPLEIEGHNVSSTLIRRLIADGEVHAAEPFLGRRHTVSGTVVEGRALGRTIGFPTANVQPEPADIMLPADGVYACWASVDANATHSVPAVVNIGVKPTFGHQAERTIEAHLLNTRADLYGHWMKLSFVKHLRPERKFADTDSLRRQIEADCRAAIIAIEQSI